VAVDKIRRAQYDIVLMDMQMPEMDGYEAAVYIRKQMKNDIPIIAMTAHAMSGEREKCIKLGMNDYIAKPFKAAELERLVVRQR
jgi:CheY-like chemotaxis protein